MKRLTLLLALSFALPGCFPTFPDEGALKNLRTIAIQQDPAMAILDGQSIPQVTLRALVIDPADPEGTATTHTWELDLGEDFEDAELLEGLIPDGPWGSEIDLNFAVLLGGGVPGGGPPGDGARDELEPPAFLPVAYNAGLLPVSHFAEDDEQVRESLKFVNFLIPDFESLPVPPTVPGTRPTEAYLDALAAAGEAAPPESWNANPNIIKITVNQGEQTFEGEMITEHLTVLDIGTVEAGAGVRFDVEVADDKDQQETAVEIYWTHGTPGLPATEDDDDGGFGGFAGNDEPECYEPKEGDPEAQDGEGFGGGAGLSEAFEPDRAFGWTAPCSVMNGPIRLFLIARDSQGGMAWQELRVRME